MQPSEWIARRVNEIEAQRHKAVDGTQWRRTPHEIAVDDFLDSIYKKLTQ